MTEKQIERIKKLGLKVEDFKPRDKEAEHFEETENALIELAELVDTAITEHENALIELAEIIMGGE